MNQVCAVRCLAGILLVAPVLFGQHISGPSQWSRLPTDITLPDWTEAPPATTKTQHPLTTAKIVTVQQLSHKVPGKARREMEKAETARIHKQADEAIRHYSKAISIDPEYVAARNDLAVVYMNHSNLELGLEQLRDAIRVDAHNPILFKNLAIGLTWAHQFDDAERIARQAVDLDRTGPQVRMLLGLVLVEERKFTTEALRSFEQTSDVFPMSHLLAGRVLLAQGDVERAKSEIRMYLATGDHENRIIATEWLNILDHPEENVAALSPH